MDEQGPKNRAGTPASAPQSGLPASGVASVPRSADPRSADPRSGEAPKALSVTELTRRVQQVVDRGLADRVWVEGEVSGARHAAQGHVYFTVKDERAAIDVVLYKLHITPRTRAMITDGARVQLWGRVTFWPVRGRLQFAAERVAPAGRGAQLEALERLKKKLEAEGLFDPRRKRPLPADPRTIGVLTSVRGAAIHDIVAVAERRGGAHVLLCPAQVQGEGAARSIAFGLGMLARVPGVDVIIVGRGGGSAEDLLAFNDESVARAIAACPVPVVSAVGHEIDVTLVDLVADARAATPSEAAERVVPDRAARRDRVRQTALRLERALRHRFAEARGELAELARKVRDPRLAIAAHQQLLDDQRRALEDALASRLARARRDHASLDQRLARRHPGLVLAERRSAARRAEERMVAALRARLADGRAELASFAGRLDAMSPLSVLARGYALATTKDGRAVRDAKDARPGDRLDVRVRAAKLEVEVLDVREVPPERER